ncbi:DMT family transporter [Thiomonas sp. X19]|uniref:DMT family transporter n=1 Tax=Thiomonas sp. X19 TaxID=1050370 RepID=UPI000DD87675|nr:DMT family transporter [Thiomonas sp. X19]
MHTSRQTLAAISGLMLNAFVWGVSWWPFRDLRALGLNPLWATAAIYGLSTAAILLARPRVLGALLRNPALWLILLSSGATNAAFNWGVTEGDVVRVVLLFYLMPVWATLLARWLLQERLTPLVGLRLVLALAGAMVVLWPPGGGLPLPQHPADWLGVVGGMTFALNNVLLRKYAHTPPEARGLAMFAGGTLVAGGLASALAAAGVASGLPVPTLPLVLAVGLLALAFLAANLGLQYGAERLPSSLTAVVMTVEIVFASGSAVLLGAEQLSVQALIGGSLILLAILLAAWRQPALPPQPPQQHSPRETPI